MANPALFFSLIKNIQNSKKPTKQKTNKQTKKHVFFHSAFSFSRRNKEIPFLYLPIHLYHSGIEKKKSKTKKTPK